MTPVSWLRDFTIRILLVTGLDPGLPPNPDKDCVSAACLTISGLCTTWKSLTLLTPLPTLTSLTLLCCFTSSSDSLLLDSLLLSLEPEKSLPVLFWKTFLLTPPCLLDIWLVWLAATLLVSKSSWRSSTDMEDILEDNPVLTALFPPPTCRTNLWRVGKPGLLTIVTPVSISICLHLWLLSPRSWVNSISAVLASSIALSTSSIDLPCVETKAPTKLDLFLFSFSHASLACSICNSADFLLLLYPKLSSS